MAENEVIFRQANEKIHKTLEELDKKAVADGHSTSLMITEDIPLHFYCECSNEKCRERIQITHTQYGELHKNSSQFIVLPGHQVAEIEKIIKKNPNYFVVEKFKVPPEEVDGLNPTDL